LQQRSPANVTPLSLGYRHRPVKVHQGAPQPGEKEIGSAFGSPCFQSSLQPKEPPREVVWADGATPCMALSPGFSTSRTAPALLPSKAPHNTRSTESAKVSVKLHSHWARGWSGHPLLVITRDIKFTLRTSAVLRKASRLKREGRKRETPRSRPSNLPHFASSSTSDVVLHRVSGAVNSQRVRTGESRGADP